MDPREDPTGRAQPPPPLWPKAGRPAPPHEQPHASGPPSVDRDGSSAAGDAGSTPAQQGAGSDGTRSGRRGDDDTRNGSGGGTGAFFRELPILVLVAFLLAFLLRTFVLQVFFIPSSSMEPTLRIDDRMVVEKVTFRFREPRRGDVVVFEGEDEPLGVPLTGGDRFVQAVGQFLGVIPTSARDFVKRVIAVGGDEVRIDEGQVFVNDVALDEPYVVFGDEDTYGPVTVPEDELFFLGDNRPNSSDSRRSLGFIREDSVVGRAVVIIWPLEHWDTLTDVHHDLDASQAHGEPGEVVEAVAGPSW